MLRLFSRAVRARLLYLGNNPTYLKALENLRASFGPIWKHTDELVLEVNDVALSHEGRLVLHEPDKSGDALPWIFYKDGVRELRLAPGVEDSEIVTLVQIVARVRKAAPYEDDLITLLWEEDFQFLQYKYVDIGLDDAAVAPLEPGEERPRLVDSAALREPPTEDVGAPGLIKMEDFQSTLYFLDESERERLRAEIEQHYRSDLRGDVIAILLDVFEQQTDPAIRDEISGVLETLLVQLLASGQLGTVAYLLREAQIAAHRGREVSPTQRQTLLALLDRLSEPEAVAQLLQSLDERAELPDREQLAELFESLRVSALGTLLEWLGRVEKPGLRVLLEGAAERLASSNIAELVRLIGSSDREVATEAMKRAAALKTVAAVPALGRHLAAPDAERRLCAVRSLAQIASPGGLQLLERALEDPDRDVRMAAARGLSAAGYRAALPRLEALITGKRLPDSELGEKMVVFEAYGSLCGDAGIPLLDGILNRRGLFGKREDAEYRACAALALGRIGTEKARASLQRAAGDREILVRNAVGKALRGTL
jgi:HEAT repeat protein